MKKSLISLLILPFFGLILSAPLAKATCVDEDKDKFYTDQDSSDPCLEEEWPLGTKGIEDKKCDFATIDINNANQPDASKVYNPDIAGATVKGKEINPNQIEVNGNGIDEDCDGEDGQLVDGDGKGIGDLIATAIKLLLSLASGISALIIVWGGIQYSAASGDENKTAKARKTIISAVIGLIISLSAYLIINYFVGNFVS